MRKPTHDSALFDQISSMEKDRLMRQGLGTSVKVPFVSEVRTDSVVEVAEVADVELLAEEDWSPMIRADIAFLSARYEAGLIDEALYRSAVTSLLSIRPQWDENGNILRQRPKGQLL